MELWFESCVERGVLDHALREANFRPFQPNQTKKGQAQNVRRRDFREVIYRRAYRVEEARISILTVRNFAQLLDPSELGPAPESTD